MLSENSFLKGKIDIDTLWYINIGLILLMVTMMHFHKEVDQFIEKNIKPSKIQGNLTEKGIDWVRLVIFMIPLLMLILIDHEVNDWVRWTGFEKIIPEKTITYVLRILGGYGIVQVLAQDLGVQTGKVQRNLIQHPILQGLLLLCGAYSVTGLEDEAVIGALMYLILKYNVSGNRTSAVCFEDV
jgi:hypothetical protein